MLHANKAGVVVVLQKQGLPYIFNDLPINFGIVLGFLIMFAP